MNGSIGLDPKLALKLSDKIDGSISGKSDVYGEFLKFNLVTRELAYPILEEGTKLRCKPKAHFNIKINSVLKWSYTPEFKEYIYQLNWSEL